MHARVSPCLVYNTSIVHSSTSICSSCLPSDIDGYVDEEEEEQEPEGSWLVAVNGKEYLGEKANTSDILKMIKRTGVRNKTGIQLILGQDVPLWKIYNYVQEKGGWTKIKVGQ